MKGLRGDMYEYPPRLKRGGNACASSLISLRRSSTRVARLALARCSVLTKRENRGGLGREKETERKEREGEPERGEKGEGH